MVVRLPELCSATLTFTTRRGLKELLNEFIQQIATRLFDIYLGGSSSQRYALPHHRQKIGYNTRRDRKVGCEDRSVDLPVIYVVERTRNMPIVRITTICPRPSYTFSHTFRPCVLLRRENRENNIRILRCHPTLSNRWLIDSPRLLKKCVRWWAEELDETFVTCE